MNPLSNGSRTCPWSDPNGDGKFQSSEVNPALCSAFSGGVGFSYAPGIRWPYSDEVTAGVETQLAGAVRFGAMFYFRTNRDQFGQRNIAVPSSAYTPFTIAVPNGPGGSVQSPKPTTVTVYNLSPALTSANNTVRSNESYLDTEYKGVEFTATKRFSRKWQMQAGFTIGKNEGRITTGNDLNDPNVTLYPNGIVGNDSELAFRLSGSYRLPWDVSLAGSMLANNGYPYVSTFNVTQAIARAQGLTLTRSSQTVSLSQRGEERYPNVTMFDIRLSRTFRFGERSISPQFDIFNLTNADTVVSHTVAVGSSYLSPAEILSPRIIRLGFSLNFSRSC